LLQISQVHGEFSLNPFLGWLLGVADLASSVANEATAIYSLLLISLRKD
jgi:hypothetical protein